MKIRWKLLHPDRSYNDFEHGRIIKDWECKIKDFTIAIHKDSSLLNPNTNSRETKYSVFVNKRTGQDFDKERIIIHLYNIPVHTDREAKKYAIIFLKEWLEEGLQQLERIEK
jgi:hypothetical protein